MRIAVRSAHDKGVKDLDDGCDGGPLNKRATSVASATAGVVGQKPMICDIPFVQPESLAAAQNKFAWRSSDVIITTFPKTGTTWMQQVCHQLRTGGSMDFEEISEEGVVPWLEVSPSFGIGINAEQIASPRCFKTFGMDIWRYYIEIWKCRKLSNVSVVVHEAMKKDLNVLLPDIAQFMGLGELKGYRYAKAAEMSSFEFMKNHVMKTSLMIITWGCDSLQSNKATGRILQQLHLKWG
jgi:hypothetical protein